MKNIYSFALIAAVLVKSDTLWAAAKVSHSIGYNNVSSFLYSIEETLPQLHENETHRTQFRENLNENLYPFIYSFLQNPPSSLNNLVSVSLRDLSHLLQKIKILSCTLSDHFVDTQTSFLKSLCDSIDLSNIENFQYSDYLNTFDRIQQEAFFHFNIPTEDSPSPVTKTPPCSPNRGKIFAKLQSTPDKASLVSHSRTINNMSRNDISREHMARIRTQYGVYKDRLIAFPTFESYFDSLFIDPDHELKEDRTQKARSGKATQNESNVVIEVIAGIDAVERSLIPGPLVRSTTKGIDFYDGLDNPWDVKSPRDISWPYDKENIIVSIPQHLQEIDQTTGKPIGIIMNTSFITPKKVTELSTRVSELEICRTDPAFFQTKYIAMESIILLSPFVPPPSRASVKKAKGKASATNVNRTKRVLDFNPVSHSTTTHN